MATKFIGFQRKNGSFTSKETGELVVYDNYDLYFITGGVPDVVGYYPTEFKKIKGGDLRKIIGYDSKAGDDVVLKKLHDMINQEVMMSMINLDDKAVLTNLLPLENKVNSK